MNTLLLFAVACSDVDDHDHHHDHDHGVTTTVTLNFTPTEGGDTLSFTWADPEDDGDPIIDDIVLPDASDADHIAQTYDLSVEFWNELEDPAEDVTAEVLADAEAHQVFFTGSGVESEATGDNAEAVIEAIYADEDANGLPLGLDNSVTTLGLGSGELVVTLRHMAPENDEAVKTETAAEDVAAGGFTAIGGDNDVQITFPITVE